MLGMTCPLHFSTSASPAAAAAAMMCAVPPAGAAGIEFAPYHARKVRGEAWSRWHDWFAWRPVPVKPAGSGGPRRAADPGSDPS